MSSVGKCPDCDRVISFLFPMHTCVPKQREGIEAAVLGSTNITHTGTNSKE